MSDFDYNPLYDVHLKNYFSSPHMQKHLRKMGLISSQQGGDEVYARHQAMMELILKNRESQLMKMAELRRKLDAAEKVGTCRRIRSGQSPESFKRIKPSRSMSRGRRDTGGERQRRFSNSFEEKDNIVQMETQYAPPESRRGRDAFQRLSANVKRFNYLHKMDDPTLIAYQESLRNQLDRLERFREISFGVHSIARQPPVAHGSWFFRRRSINNMRTRKHSTGRADSSRTSCPPPKRRDSASRLPPIAIRSKSKSAASKPPASAPRLPPTGNRSRSVQKKATPSSSAKKSDVILPVVAAAGGAATVAAVAAVSARSPSPVLPPVNQTAPSPSPPASLVEAPVEMEEHNEELAAEAFEIPADELVDHHEDQSEPPVEEYEEQVHEPEAFKVPTDELIENHQEAHISLPDSVHEEEQHEEHHFKRRSISEDESEPEYAEEDQEEVEHHHKNGAFEIPATEAKVNHEDSELHEEQNYEEEQHKTEAFAIPADELVDHHEEHAPSPVDSLDEPHQPEKIHQAEAFEVSADELVHHEEHHESHISLEGSIHEEHQRDEPGEEHDESHHQSETFEISAGELVSHEAEETEHKEPSFQQEEERVLSPTESIHEDKPAEAFEISAEELVEHGTPHEEEDDHHEIHKREEKEPMIQHHHLEHEESVPSYRETETFEVPPEEEVQPHSPVIEEEKVHESEAFEVPVDEHHQDELHELETHISPEGSVHEKEDHEEAYFEEHHEEHKPEAFEIPAEELVSHEEDQHGNDQEEHKKKEEIHEPEAFEVPADELVEHHEEIHHSPRETLQHQHSTEAFEVSTDNLVEHHEIPSSPKEVHQPEAFEVSSDELITHDEDNADHEESGVVHHETEAFEIPADDLTVVKEHHEKRHSPVVYEDIHKENHELVDHREDILPPQHEPEAYEIPADKENVDHEESEVIHHKSEAFEIPTELVHHETAESDIQHEGRQEERHSPVAFEAVAEDSHHFEEHHHHHSIEIEPVEIAEQLSPNEQDDLHHHVTITTTGPTPRPPSVDEDKMSTDSIVIQDQDPMTQSMYDDHSGSPTDFEHRYDQEDRTSETAWSVKSGADSEANNNNDDDVKEQGSLTKTSHNGNVVEHQSVMMDELEHTNNVSSL